MKNVQFTASTVLRLSALATALALAGCGGGGSSTPSGSNTGTGGTGTVITCTAPQVLVNGVCTTPPPTVTPPDLQTTVPTPTYAPGSPELIAFNEINAVRASLGLGLVAQNAYLDLAAKNHATYIGQNIETDRSVYGHIENAAYPGFTGITSSDRARFAGYGGNAGEILTNDAPNAYSLTPVQGFLNTVYHRVGIIDNCTREIGIGEFTKVLKNNIPFVPFVINGGGKTCQRNASDFVMHYPASGQTNLPVTMMAESPNPIKDLPLNADGSLDFLQTSYPISVASVPGTTIAVTSMTVTAQGETTPLPMTTITAATDPNPGYLSSNWIFFVGKAPFKAKTTYNVAFVGTVNGATITQNWSFTTR